MYQVWNGEQLIDAVAHKLGLRLLSVINQMGLRYADTKLKSIENGSKTKVILGEQVLVFIPKMDGERYTGRCRICLRNGR